MENKTISTDKAPKAAGPYSQAVTNGSLIFCSGQIGIDPKNNTLVEGIEKQAEQVMHNLLELLKAAQSDFDHVMKTTIYLSDMNNYAKVNEIYGSYFKKNKPARATVQVSRLPKNALIEIDLIAVKK